MSAAESLWLDLPERLPRQDIPRISIPYAEPRRGRHRRPRGPVTRWLTSIIARDSRPA